MVRYLLVGVVFTATACTYDLTSLGRPCDDTHGCGAGQRCQKAGEVRRCVAVDSGGADSTTRDTGRRDGAPDGLGERADPRGAGLTAHSTLSTTTVRSSVSTPLS